mmetsp:Transcript_20500/g.48109  ORF Transcript_20500/g.48109 Transcript_20500/m.48109 type:complete len:205 (+) Transcript_20500:903-1517(+)
MSSSRFSISTSSSSSSSSSESRNSNRCIPCWLSPLYTISKISSPRTPTCTRGAYPTTVPFGRSLDAKAPRPACGILEMSERRWSWHFPSSLRNSSETFPLSAQYRVEVDGGLGRGSGDEDSSLFRFVCCLTCFNSFNRSRFHSLGRTVSSCHWVGPTWGKSSMTFHMSSSNSSVTSFFVTGLSSCSTIQSSNSSMSLSAFLKFL